MKIAVVGVGRMGRWLAAFARKNLGEVVVADIAAARARKVARELGVEWKTPSKAAATADIVFIAVPIAETPEVLSELGKVVKKGALLADISSVKKEVCKRMRELDGPELVSIHPLFGPGARTLAGKDIVVVPVKPGKNYFWLRKKLRSLGARVVEMDAEAHDRAMSVVQCLTHFILLTHLKALLSMEGELKEGLKTPFSHSLTELSKAMVCGGAELVGEIQIENEYADVVRKEVLKICRRLDEELGKGRLEEVRKIFRRAERRFEKKSVEKAYERLYEVFEEVSG
ncbi:MAG: prephenate dehydrogenase/arogenate dehydrogenase family protein [Candidatus Hadarchaeales archaeon]